MRGLKNLILYSIKIIYCYCTRVVYVSDIPYLFVFQRGEEAYGCLNLGMLNLWDNKDFVR